MMNPAKILTSVRLNLQLLIIKYLKVAQTIPCPTTVLLRLQRSLRKPRIRRSLQEPITGILQRLVRLESWCSVFIDPFECS